MQREILFRGQRLDNGEWTYGSYKNRHCRHSIVTQDSSHIDFDLQIMPETVGQFTGLPDKNGTKIFEGDIVKSEKWVSVGKYEKCKGIVTFISTGFRIVCIDDWAGIHTDLNSNCEIIGNIHEKNTTS